MFILNVVMFEIVKFRQPQLKSLELNVYLYFSRVNPTTEANRANKLTSPPSSFDF